MSQSRRPNHLLGQTSPYLLQHLHNPVDWYPWGPEALERARAEDRPIFLSIGYAACHWCHVMERESFEDPAIAEVLNGAFVPIKVDREERPDLDEIYMNAVQLMTGSGGWPLNVFLTPDLRPFVGGTYFPPDPGRGRISFRELLDRVLEAWSTQRDQVLGSATTLTRHLQRVATGDDAPESRGPVTPAEGARAIYELTQRFDPVWGGFGAAPKFPPDGALALLLRKHVRSGEATPMRIVERTLDAMARGGVYDHVGGGFARYSVDERWLVPHFEKMLYNQALLVPLYVDAWRLSGRPLHRSVVEDTLDFVRRELTGAGGGFWSSLDADSEGEEGKFYVWTPEEIHEALGSRDGAWFCEAFGIQDGGNFEGRSIPNLIGATLDERAGARGIVEADRLERAAPLRGRLREAREARVRPATDDKILTAWNGLMISAFARAHQAFGRSSDLDAAQGAAAFLRDELVRGDRLLASHRDGRSALNAYLDDHAFLARGLVDLYEACFDFEWLLLARRLARTMIARFEDTERGGFWFTSDDHEETLTRNRSLYDGALPSGSGVAAETLLRLARHLDETEFEKTALRAIEAARPSILRAPSAHASMLLAADTARGPWTELAVVGADDDPGTRDLLDVARRTVRPCLVVAAAAPGDVPREHPLLADKTAPHGAATAWVCRNYACQAPTGDPAELERQLEAARAEFSSDS